MTLVRSTRGAVERRVRDEAAIRVATARALDGLAAERESHAGEDRAVRSDLQPARDERLGGLSEPMEHGAIIYTRARL